MQISKYNKIFEVNNKKYIFNSFTCSLAEIDSNFFTMLDKVEKDDMFSSKEKLFADMIEGGIIVENDFDEISELENKYWKTRNANNRLSFTILPTLNCNYNCPYCYEKKSNKVMNDEIIKKLIKFIKESSEDTNQISVAWYGGEPLLAKSVIEKISTELVEFCENTHKSYDAAIVSNGYLINDEVAKMLVDAKIKRCQITLDGTKSTHDSKRFDKKHKELGSFEKTIESIMILNKVGIKATIRFNIDKNNFNELEDLLIILKNNGLNKSALSLGWLNAISDECANIAASCLDYEEFCKIELQAYELLLKYGFAKNFDEFYPQLRSACSVINKTSFVVNPDGDIFKCWNDIEDPTKSVGNITSINSMDDIVINNRFVDWSPFIYDECSNCDILPICLGGCPYMANKDGKPLCSKWKYTIDKFLPVLINKSNLIKEV